MLINELQERYEITRKPLYSRIKSLELDLGKNADNKTFANDEQVKLLDQLHDHLKAGGKLKSFVPITDVEIENGHDTPPGKPKQLNLALERNDLKDYICWTLQSQYQKRHHI